MSYIFSLYLGCTNLTNKHTNLSQYFPNTYFKMKSKKKLLHEQGEALICFQYRHNIHKLFCLDQSQEYLEE